MTCGPRVLLAAGLLFLTAPAALHSAPAPSQVRVAATLQAAEALRAVKRLQHAYTFYVNEGQWSQAADLCIATATAQFGTEVIPDRKALRAYLMQQAGRSAPGLASGQLNTHLIMQPIITLAADGRSAKGTWHEMQMLGRFGRSAMWQGGIYENEYTQDAGVWKISRIHFYPQYAGAYDDYGHKAPAKWNIPYHFEALHVGVAVPESAITALESGSRTEPVGIRRRADALSDETQIQNLQHALGYYLDRKLWDDVADLFTAKGTLQMAQHGVQAGREHIRSALEAAYGPNPLRHGELFDHILLGTLVTLDADGRHAAARTTSLGQIGLNGQFARWELGTFENRFVREAGQWKFESVRYYLRMVTDYDRGWASDAQPAQRRVALRFPNPVTQAPRAQRRPANRTLRDALAASGPGAGLELLERQIRASIAVDSVENLNSSYGYYIDESAWDEMADTFGSTGAKEVTGAGVYVGTERIRKILKLRGPAGGRSANFYTIHQLTQPVIHVSDDGLTARARLRLFQAGGNADGSSGSWIGGIYENTALFENGEWKFGIQDLHHLYNASYRNGWARVGPAATTLAGRAPSPRDQRGGGITQGLGGARSGPRLVDEMPPDRAIRSRQYAFPEITEPAFHYVNPVSGRKPADLLP